MTTTAAQPLFPLGQIIVTKPAFLVLLEEGLSTYELLRRHQRGDFGIVSCTDNAGAVALDRAIMSEYDISDTVNIWVTTKPDRSSTRISLSWED